MYRKNNTTSCDNRGLNTQSSRLLVNLSLNLYQKLCLKPGMYFTDQIKGLCVFVDKAFKSVQFILKFALLLSVVSLVSACSDTFEEVLDNPPGSTSISLSNDSVFLSSIGGQYTASAKVVDAQGVAFVDQPQFAWVSQSANIVSVDNNGVITANGLGETSITVCSVSGTNTAANGLSTDMRVVVSNDVITINGIARYEDREYGSSGFVAQQNYFKAIRFARVTVVDDSGVEVGGIGSVYTDENGTFSISGILNSSHHIHIGAITDNSLGLDLEVRDRGEALYTVSREVDVQQADNFAIDVPLGSDASGAFNVLDVFINAAQFTLAHTNLNLVSLAAFWEVNNSDGTYFCSGFDSIYCDNGKGVYIYNSVNGDTDEYDDDVLYHEFGHYFAQAVSRDDSYGGCHVLSSTDLDLRLSWSEGWGDFFPAAIKTWLSEDVSRRGLLSTQTSLNAAYIDTFQSTTQIFITLDSLSTTVYKTAANELAVAKILFALYQRYGMNDIVEVLTAYLPDVATPVNLESFWDGWLVTHGPGATDKAVLTGFYNERSVFYQEDEFEADNLINPERKINLNTSEVHYLYSEQSATDIDYVAFDVVSGNQYTLATSNLTSGADTYIKVFKSDGTPLTVNNVVMENDDADENAYYGYDGSCGSSRVKNNGTALSSSLSFTSPSTGTYYAQLRTTTDPDPYFSAGRYGTFVFKVIQN